MDKNTDFRHWSNVTRAFNVELTLLNPNDEMIFEDDDIVVIIDEQGAVDIEDFNHPENCVYVFGQTHMNKLIETPHDFSVRIDYEGHNCLFGSQACAIILKDRSRKL
jgi:hypothetical protein